MFSIANISAVVLLFLATVARAEFFITSYNIQINGSLSVTWTSTDPDKDALFVTVELQNPAFRKQFALASTVPASQGQFSGPTPGLLPGDGYSFQLIANNNVTQILAQTPDFTLVGDTPLTSSSLSAGPPSTASSSTSSSSSASASNSASTTASGGSSSVSTFTAPSTGPGPISTPIAPSTSSSASAANSSGSALPNTGNTGSAASGLVPAAAGTSAVAIVACVAAWFL